MGQRDGGPDEHCVSSRPLPTGDVRRHDGLAVPWQQRVGGAEHEGQADRQQPDTDGEITAPDHVLERVLHPVDESAQPPRPRCDEAVAGIGSRGLLLVGRIWSVGHSLAGRPDQKDDIADVERGLQQILGVRTQIVRDALGRHRGVDDADADADRVDLVPADPSGPIIVDELQLLRCVTEPGGRGCRERALEATRLQPRLPLLVVEGRGVGGDHQWFTFEDQRCGLDEAVALERCVVGPFGVVDDPVSVRVDEAAVLRRGDLGGIDHHIDRDGVGIDHESAQMADAEVAEGMRRCSPGRQQAQRADGDERRRNDSPRQRLSAPAVHSPAPSSASVASATRASRGSKNGLISSAVSNSRRAAASSPSASWIIPA